MSNPSTVTSVLQITLDTTEIPTAAIAPSVPVVQSRSPVHNAFDVATTLNATSTPPAAVASYQEIKNSASGTLDLTALHTLFQASVDCTTMKLQALHIKNLDPTNVFIIAAGASNGYAIGGNAVKVQPGGSAIMFFNGGLAAVDSTHKTLDYTGNAGTGDAQVALILG
jgi:hypothetical protein